MIDFVALRHRFPTLVERTYFATHGFGPILRETLADLDDYRRSLSLRNRGVATWYERVVEIRGLIARLVGADDGEIALGPNATACQAQFAAALRPTMAVHTIVTCDQDFPSTRYLWQAQAQRGFRVVETSVEKMIDAIDDSTALVALPLVAYANGALLPVKEIIDAAHARGALVICDAYQAAGIVPIDVHALGVDALVSGTNKWLSASGMGLAFMYVRRALADRLAPAYPGWFAHRDPLAFDDEFAAADGARRFEQGAPAVEAIYGARAGIKFALEVGVNAIHARSLDLQDHLIAGLDARKIPLATPRAQRGGMIALAVANPKAIAERLAFSNIDVDTRPGIGLRVSCHPCNTTKDIDRLLAAL